jgi:hypothetical protein
MTLLALISGVVLCQTSIDNIATGHPQGDRVRKY